MTRIKGVHPFAEAFPMMTDDEMDRLVQDIKQEGQIEPCIVNHDGVLLDGRNRLAACERLGIEPIVRTVSPTSETAFIASLNIHRRHMTVGERQALAPVLEESFKNEAQKRMAAGGRGGLRIAEEGTALVQYLPSTAMAQAAKALDISERAGYQAKRVAEHAPELLEEVRAGTLTLKAAEREVTERLAEDRERQEILLAEVDATIATASRKPIKPDLGGGISHPARYSDPLIPVFAAMLEQHMPAPSDHYVLDPFAGTGKIHQLRDYKFQTIGIEIEPEWAAMHDGTIVGDALNLPYYDELPTGYDGDGYPISNSEIGAICTSPTYGNRLADHHNASDPESRRSYTHDLGRELHANNSGAMHWGDDYRDFHERAWREAFRVLMWDGVFILNIKDFIRNGEWQHVTYWHLTTLAGLGLRLLEVRAIPLRGLRQGANSAARVPFETVAVFKKSA